MSDDEFEISVLDDLDLPQFLPGEDVPILPVGQRWPWGLHFSPTCQPLTGEWWAQAAQVELIRDSDPAMFLRTSFWWRDMALTLYTSYLGLNHQYFSGPPLVWETMMQTNFSWGSWQYRYATQAAANLGHQRIVARLQQIGCTLAEDFAG